MVRLASAALLDYRYHSSFLKAGACFAAIFHIPDDFKETVYSTFPRLTDRTPKQRKEFNWEKGKPKSV